MEIKNSARGFEYTEFTDSYGAKCSLQKSSLATEDAIWFGVDDANPIIMAFDAKRFGIESTETNGWVTYPVPDEVLLTTRMHLSQEQVKELLPYLEHFAKTGELS